MSFKQGLNTMLDNAIHQPRTQKAVRRRAERNVLIAAERFVFELDNPLPSPDLRKNTRERLIREVNRLREITHA